jgi:hypothetical protein
VWGMMQMSSKIKEYSFLFLYDNCINIFFLFIPNKIKHYFSGVAVWATSIPLTGSVKLLGALQLLFITGKFNKLA